MFHLIITSPLMSISSSISTRRKINILFSAIVFWVLIAIELVEMTNRTNRVVGGEMCKIRDYPFMVSLRKSDSMSHISAGSLISAKWVLTAAHGIRRFEDAPWDVTAVFGEERSDSLNGENVLAEKIFIHELYFKPSYGDNDIGLVSLTRDVNLVIGRIQLIKLPYFSEDTGSVTTNKQFTSAGWGPIQKLGVKDIPPFSLDAPVLRCVNLTAISYEECHKMTKFATRNMICIYNESGDKGNCISDRGAPLFIAGVQFGISSLTQGCGIPKTIDSFIRVDTYLDFIEKSMRNFAKKPTSNSILIFLNMYNILQIFQ